MPPVPTTAKSCETCSRPLQLVSTTVDGQKLEATSKGWYPMARKGGKWAVRCPEHKPTGTPSSPGRSTP